ncbi:hypothetical protein LTS10_002825 [Elasticomyces elasticus]|nr:hypothetical protein LTS10_002825 [Elasticomyces elasticus]
MFTAELAEELGSIVTTPGVDGRFGTGLGLGAIGSTTLPPYRGADSSDADSSTSSAADSSSLSQSQHGYRPLKTDEVRLLILNPGLPDDPIQCFLETYTVDQAKNYDALSYVWGNTEDLLPIQVDGCAFKVTRNLHDFLTSYRTDQSCPILWIDAICINQKDDRERSAQVRLMKRIYEGAESIVIWLGLDAKGTASAIQHIEYIYDNVWVRHNPFDHSEERTLAAITRRDIAKIVGEDHIISEDTWAGIHDLLERPWWSRIWVYQEATAPTRHNKIVHCGPYSIAFDELLVADKIIQHLAVNRDGFLDFPRQASLTGTFMDTYSKLRCSYHERGESEYLRMADLLPSLRGFEATNPRDKLYALIPTSLDGFDLLDVDYSLSIPQVYTNAALSFMRHHRNLDVLGHCTTPSQNPEFRLPSWVPDWTSDRAPVHFFKRKLAAELIFTENEGGGFGFSMIVDKISKLYNASSDTEYELRVDETSTKMFCKGFQFDVIEAVGEVNNGSYHADQIAGTWRQWLEEISVPLSEVAGSYPRSRGNGTTDATLARIWTADCNRIGVDTARRLNSSESSRSRTVSSQSRSRSPPRRRDCSESRFASPQRRSVSPPMRSGPRSRSISLTRRSSDSPRHTLSPRRQSVSSSTNQTDEADCLEAIEVINDRDLDRNERSSSSSPAYSTAGATIVGAHPATFRRRPISTQKRYLGLGPEHVALGDVVTILMGAQLPIILRRVDSHYILIGEAYVHGIMDGEAVPKEKDGVHAGFSEEFELR